jgi:hypothetical protein
VHCCTSHLCSQEDVRLCASRVDQNQELSTHPPSQHPHPQNSRFTPRCPSVVLWTPCSGVEWRVFEPTIRVWRSGNDAQAACEPGGRGGGGVPVHPARLRSHRTSPAQALLTILSRHAATSDLLSHCHRRGYGVRCALAYR